MGDWIRVWARAVIAPATRRALAVWAGAGIVAAVIFGPTSMQPHDLTSLALHDPPVGAVLGVTWLLLFVPTARIVVRADAALYLRALPHRPWPPRGLAGAAVVVLQLPWLLLWWFGEGPRGLAVVAAVTVPVVALAAWRPRRAHVRTPRWRTGSGALRAVYMRALVRKAGDALVRGLGLATLAGFAGALFVRNNQLTGVHAGVLASAVIMVVLVPATIGALLPLAEAHRGAAPLVAALAIPSRGVLATVVAAVYALAAVLAAAVVVAVTGNLEVVPIALATATGAALATTRVVARAPDAARIASGAVVAAAISIVWLGWLGATGAALAVVTGIVAVLA